MFHKIKTKTYIKNLRHGSLYMTLMYMYIKFQDFSLNIKLNILVQKI